MGGEYVHASAVTSPAQCQPMPLAWRISDHPGMTIRQWILRGLGWRERTTLVDQRRLVSLSLPIRFCLRTHYQPGLAGGGHTTARLEIRRSAALVQWYSYPRMDVTVPCAHVWSAAPCCHSGKPLVQPRNSPKSTQI